MAEQARGEDLFFDGKNLIDTLLTRNQPYEIIVKQHNDR